MTIKVHLQADIYVYVSKRDPEGIYALHWVMSAGVTRRVTGVLGGSRREGDDGEEVFGMGLGAGKGVAGEEED